MKDHIKISLFESVIFDIQFDYKENKQKRNHSAKKTLMCCPKD